MRYDTHRIGIPELRLEVQLVLAYCRYDTRGVDGSCRYIPAHLSGGRVARFCWHYGRQWLAFLPVKSSILILVEREARIQLFGRKRQSETTATVPHEPKSYSANLNLCGSSS